MIRMSGCLCPLEQNPLQDSKYAGFEDIFDALGFFLNKSAKVAVDLDIFCDPLDSSMIAMACFPLGGN